tara:strand:- start:947 stop:1789 length:843 start_codon:yes stop_codon:yes gene_type:complete
MKDYDELKSFLQFLDLSDTDSEGHKNYFKQEQIESHLINQVGESLPIDLVYMYQDYLTVGSIYKLGNEFFQQNKRFADVLDIGSRFETALAFSHITNVTYLEPRDVDFPMEESSSERKVLKHISTFGFLKGEAQAIPAENESYDYVVSLHAMEHFGLGRYGDTIDYYGDQKGLKEFHRVLKKDGKLILSIPCGFNTIIRFNKERIYHPSVVDEMLDNCGFNLEEGFVICPHTIGKEGDSTMTWGNVYYTPSILERFREQYEKDNSFISPNAAYFAIANKK